METSRVEHSYLAARSKGKTLEASNCLVVKVRRWKRPLVFPCLTQHPAPNIPQLSWGVVGIFYWVKISRVCCRNPLTPPFVFDSIA